MLQSEGAVAAEQESEGLFDFRALFGREARAFHANHVKRREFIVAVRHAVGGDVLADGGIALRNRVVADVNELMKHRPAAEECAVAYGDVAGEQNVIGEDIVIAERDIVSEMDARHQKIVLSDPRDAAVFRAAMDRDVLA
ncbi:MAG: hypothetical protein RL117_62 [Verrucomicrobiota bacterium]